MSSWACCEKQIDANLKPGIYLFVHFKGGDRGEVMFVMVCGGWLTCKHDGPGLGFWTCCIATVIRPIKTQAPVGRI